MVSCDAGPYANGADFHFEFPKRGPRREDNSITLFSRVIANGDGNRFYSTRSLG
ncbi:MAG: hypothetical protein IPH20_20280 [Bacteroidales bacterium]|nr:hypothetical protein [Bacteroidales bacterium]